MNDKKYCKLIMVSGMNNNKFYEMDWDGISPNFHVKYGRVESTVQTGSYPIGQWRSKYNEKVGKGYKDVTDMVTVRKELSDVIEKDNSKLSGISDKKVAEFITLMKNYTDNLVSDTYSVKADNVTAAQVAEAQRIIDHLTKTSINNLKIFNDFLVELYMIIPRRMRNVKDYLLPSIDPNDVIVKEQDNLDAISSQVALIDNRRKKKTSGSNKNILDTMGIVMAEIAVNNDTQYLVDQMGKVGKRVEGIFSVDKQAENVIFDQWIKKQKNKTSKILIHGTRNTSVLPIMQTNLKIRPAGNFQFSGKIYGEGNYFSETVSKSLNYTGYDRDKVLLVYEVHTGNPFVYDGWYKGNSFTLDYKNLSERGFDSTFVKAGGGLLNTEIIVYTENQNRLKYILWLK